MCRFIAYQGKPILLSELLYEPHNSLINQSAKAIEAEEPLNGDGFGIGWYNPTICPNPGLYVSVRPAWNDRNLRYLSKHVKSNSFMAHIRAASEGEVSEANCHPFNYENYLFMHNGGIGGFHSIKRHIRRSLSDPIYDWIRGQTDSEHLFAMILENLLATEGNVSVESMASAIEKTIDSIQQLKQTHKIEDDCYLNFVLSDGKSTVAIRYVSDPELPASTLYYSEGSKYQCVDGVCKMQVDGKDKSVLIVSEKLTNEENDWQEIPINHLCLVDENKNVIVRPMKIKHLNKSNPMKTKKGFRPKRKIPA